MKHTKAFFIKLVMTIGVLFIVLSLFFGVSFADILIIGLILTIVAFIGDLFILPRIGGVSATGADLVLAFLVIWALGSFLFDPDISAFSAALLASLFIAGGEFYYHKYLIDHLFENETERQVIDRKKNLITQTEFSDDFDKGVNSERHNNDQI
ncbi:DUF2512 family protein [Ureibacillus sp. 179-F W5.1 NHS]|uniref:DUF2512 family protein n=1 Tax=Ureibacillus sp. 179-F W5.1 NHS TaxID=3374297 RepID=UPI0038792E92